jgi:hypothetical protein
MEKMQYLINNLHTKVQQERMWWAGFPGYRKVKDTIERHLAIVCENKTDSCLPCQNGTAHSWQTCWRVQSDRHIFARLTKMADIRTNATSIYNRHCASCCYWVSSSFPYEMCANLICQYTYSPSQCSIFHFWFLCQEYQAK